MLTAIEVLELILKNPGTAVIPLSISAASSSFGENSLDIFKIKVLLLILAPEEINGIEIPDIAL